MNFQRRRRPQAQDTCISTLCHMLQRQKGKKRQCKGLKNDMASLSLKQTGKEDKQTCWQACKWFCVCEFDSVHLCECAWAPTLFILLTVWVDLINVQESNPKPKAIYPARPPMRRPTVVLPQEPATKQLSAVHAMPAMISPRSFNGAR